MGNQLFIIRSDFKGEAYRKNFAEYWSSARLVQESRESLESLAFNIVHADLEHPVSMPDRELVLLRISAVLGLSPSVLNSCRTEAGIPALILARLQRAELAGHVEAGSEAA